MRSAPMLSSTIPHRWPTPLAAHRQRFLAPGDRPVDEFISSGGRFPAVCELLRARATNRWRWIQAKQPDCHSRCWPNTASIGAWSASSAC